MRLGWFVTPLGLALGVLGLLLAVRDWRSALPLPLLLALTFAGFYLYKIRVWNDYFFALRRFVPVVLPFLLGLAAFFLVRLAAGGKLRRAAAALLALVLFGLFAAGHRPHRPPRGLARRRRFVRDVARRFGPEDVVIFEQQASIHLLSLPLWAVHGVNVLELARFNPDPRAPATTWSAPGAAAIATSTSSHTYSTDLCGLFLQRVPTGLPLRHLRVGARIQGRAHRGREPGAALHASRAWCCPRSCRCRRCDEVDVGGTRRRAGLGLLRQGGRRRPAPTAGRDPARRSTCPGRAPGATRGDRRGAGRRPADRPAVVRVSLVRSAAGHFTAGSDWHEHALRAARTRCRPGRAVLRLDVPAWRPVNTDPALGRHARPGVMVDRVWRFGDTMPGLRRRRRDAR